MKLFNSRGDTIIEVMMAVVLLGSALGIAFALSNKSVQQTQNNHERYQVQLWVNQVSERIRADYAEYIKTGANRSGYKVGAGGISGLCPPPYQPCVLTYPEYGDVEISIVDNPNTVNHVIQPALYPLNYVIIAKWYAIGSGSENRVELRYGV